MHRHHIGRALSRCAKDSHSVRFVSSERTADVSQPQAAPKTRKPVISRVSPSSLPDSSASSSRVAYRGPARWEAGSGPPGVKGNQLKSSTTKTKNVMGVEWRGGQHVPVGPNDARWQGDAEDASPTPGVGVDAEEGLTMTFTPGTFVELRRNCSTIHAVVIGEVIEDRIWFVRSLMSTGTMLQHRRTDVHFSIPNFVSVHLAERCGKKDITYDRGPLAARVEVLRRLRELVKHSEVAVQGSQQSQLHRNLDIYKHVKAPEDDRWGETTVPEVTQLLYSDPTFIEYFGVHKYLMNHPLQFVAQDDYLGRQTLSVRPKSHIQEITEVQEWIQGFREDKAALGPYKSFIKKASAVLKGVEESPPARDGPPTQTPAKHKWSVADKLILSFLLHSLQPYRSTQLDPYAAGRNAVMKDLMPAGSDVDDSAVHELLVKLGIISPWQDLVALLPQYEPNRTPAKGTAQAQAQEDSIAQAFSTMGSKPAGTVLGPEDFHPVDPLEAVRYDFGDLPVYVIDEASAEELDDGISLEHIPSEPDKYWIHVHIADPASLIHPDHVLAHQAKLRTSTMYFQHESYPLFSKSLMHHPLHGLSLGNRSNERNFDRVLTFSAKLDRSANLLESKVRAGIVRNVKRITYDNLNAFLGNPFDKPSYPFGRILEPTPQSAPLPLPPNELRDLQILQKLANEHVAMKYNMGCMSFGSNSLELKCISSSPGTEQPDMTSSSYSGFPKMEYMVRAMALQDTGARSLVSEMMKFACRIASRFALEHGVPLIRRHVDRPVTVSPDAYEELLQRRTPNMYLDIFQNLEQLKISPPAVYSTKAMPHFPLGIGADEGYARVTSPLRRYEDLVAHWQIHSILLGRKGRHRAPFDTDTLEKFIRDLTVRDRQVRKGHTLNTNFFGLLYLKRWMEDTARGMERPFGDPLASIRAIMTSRPKYNLKNRADQCNVLLPDLAITAQAIDLRPSTSTAPLSTELRVKVKSVQLGVQRPSITVVEVT